jgi:hypothetical protein
MGKPRLDVLEAIQRDDDLEVIEMSPQMLVTVRNRVTQRWYALDLCELSDEPLNQIMDVLLGKREPLMLYVVTRIVGYYSSTENWNKSKLGELLDRRRGNYELDERGGKRNDRRGAECARRGRGKAQRARGKAHCRERKAQSILATEQVGGAGTHSHPGGREDGLVQAGSGSQDHGAVADSARGARARGADYDSLADGSGRKKVGGA